MRLMMAFGKRAFINLYEKQMLKPGVHFSSSKWSCFLSGNMLKYKKRFFANSFWWTFPILTFLFFKDAFWVKRKKWWAIFLRAFNLEIPLHGLRHEPVGKKEKKIMGARVKMNCVFFCLKRGKNFFQFE